MIRHIVFWKLEDGKGGKTKAEAGAAIQAKANEIKGGIPGLLHLEVGFNYKDGEYDLALYSEFESKEAEDAYQTNPEHLKLKEVVHTYVCGRAAVDMVAQG